MRHVVYYLFLAILFAFLFMQFPETARDPQARLRMIYLLGVLALGAGSWRLRRRSGLQTLRDGAIWCMLFLSAAFLYSFHDDFLQGRLAGILLPDRPQVGENGEVRLHAGMNGHFYARAKVNGAEIKFLIDTGASDIVLAPEDARRAGFEPGQLNYDGYYSTANGTGRGASVMLASLTLGPVMLTGVRASVNQAEMPESLLGMRFLKRLRGFRVEGDTLILIP